MELKQVIEVAIGKLQAIIDIDAEESKFQEWFSQHPVIFDVLGYKRQIEHPELIYEGNKYIPDFMAQTISNEWEIIELKTADASILKNSDRRHAFFAEAEKNLSQCREYSLIFYDTACREKFNDDYKTVCHKTPSVRLIIGKNDGFDKLLVNELLSGRMPRITITTYNDIINHLKARYASISGAVIDKPNGIYIAFIICPISTDSTNEMYIADICQHGAKSRLRLFISDQNLVMQTDDAAGLTVSSMQNKIPNLYSTSTYEVEITPLKYETSISLFINGNTIFKTTVRNTDFDFSGSLDVVLGSDQTGTAQSSMMVGGFIIIKQTVDVDKKTVFRKFLECMEDEQGRRYLHEYIGHKYMHNQGHLTLGSRMTHTSNLIQEIDEHKPTLRYR